MNAEYDTCCVSRRVTIFSSFGSLDFSLSLSFVNGDVRSINYTPFILLVGDELKFVDLSAELMRRPPSMVISSNQN